MVHAFGMVGSGMALPWYMVAARRPGPMMSLIALISRWLGCQVTVNQPQKKQLQSVVIITEATCGYMCSVGLHNNNIHHLQVPSIQ